MTTNYSSANVGSVTYGQASAALSYYTPNGMTPTTGPAWSRSSSIYGGEFDMGMIVGGYTGGATHLPGISSYLSSRTVHTSKATYYTGTSFQTPTITINADNEGIASSIYYYPFIDITYTKTSGDGILKSGTFEEVRWEADYQQSQGRWETELNYAYDISGYYLPSYNYSTGGNSITLTNTSLNSNHYVCVKNNNYRVHFAKYNINGGEENLGSLSGIVSLPISINNLPSGARAFSYTNSNATYGKSFQAIGAYTGSELNLTGFTIRCYVDNYYDSITLPSPSYTQQTENTSTFTIGLSNYTSSSPSLTQEKTVTVKFKRNQRQSETNLQYNINISPYNVYNAVKLRNVTNNSITSWSLANIKSRLYRNYILLPEEKQTETLNTNLYYGSNILHVFEDTLSTTSNSYKINEYYLYYKLSAADLSNSNQLISRIFPSITFSATNASDFYQNSIYMKCYYMPNVMLKAASNTVVHDGNGITTDDIKATHNALWSYPINEYGMLGYSNYFLRLDKSVNKTILSTWLSMVNENGNMVHGGTSSGTTITSSFASALAMHYPSTYQSILTQLNNELITAINADDNLLFTCIPILVNVGYETLSRVEYSTWYLIKVIVDFRDIRTTLTNDFKLLGNSDFLRNGYWRHLIPASGDNSTILDPFTLDYSIDSSVDDKIMSPIDIINRDLYIFDAGGQDIKTISSEDADTQVFPRWKNANIVYIDMFNIANAGISSGVLGKSAFFDEENGILDNANQDDFLNSTGEYDYLYNKEAATALLRSIFDTDCPAYSYDLLVEAVQDDPTTANTLTGKGFAAAAIGYVNKNPNVISTDTPEADELLTPLHKYEDIFLTHSDPFGYKFICATAGEMLNSSTIITTVTT